MTNPLVSVRTVSRDFVKAMTPIEAMLARMGADYKDQVVRALSDVSFDIQRGQIMGLVGESGCGKSTLGRVVARLIQPTHGEVFVDDERFDLGQRHVDRRKQLRVQMVFQNPMASLNPRQRVLDIVTEAPVYHGLCAPTDKHDLARSLMQEVGLSEDSLSRLPHQFSGGQRQRIGIARALSTQPDFLICDEPVAALDVSIQAQVINLLLDLKERRNLTILFISHDLGLVRHLCDQVAVMYLGRIVELASANTIFANPKHPYTQALFAQMAKISSGRQQFQPIVGEIPSPLNVPSGCAFHPRCPIAQDECRVVLPELRAMGDQHQAACHLASPNHADRPFEAIE
ncbi:MAG: ABC transporter ATP-binding protein [Hyphomicrobiales bacterium]